MKEKNKKNWLEWTVLAISGILVFLTLGIIIYEMAFEKQTSPDIVAECGKIEKKEGYLALPVIVFNRGSQTAEDVRLEIINASGNERSQMEFQYLAGKSSVKGWATFKIDPGPTNGMQVHVLGYSTP